MVVVKKFTQWIYLFSVTNWLVDNIYVDKILMKKYRENGLILYYMRILVICMSLYMFHKIVKRGSHNGHFFCHQSISY